MKEGTTGTKMMANNVKGAILSIYISMFYLFKRVLFKKVQNKWPKICKTKKICELPFIIYHIVPVATGKNYLK